MRTIQIISILLLQSISIAQESNRVLRGVDFFPVEPGMIHYYDMLNEDGKPVSMYTRVSIENHVSSKAIQIPVKTTRFFLGTIMRETIDVYRIKSDGKVVHESTLNGQFQKLSALNTYLPADIRVGEKWGYRDPSGDVFQNRIVELIDTIHLPNGLVINDVIKVETSYTPPGYNEEVTSQFKYFAIGKGYLGFQFTDSEGKWTEVLRP